MRGMNHSCPSTCPSTVIRAPGRHIRVMGRPVRVLSSPYQPSQLLARARARTVGLDREMSDFTLMSGLWRHLRPLCSNQGYQAHQSHHMLSCGASNHTQDRHGGTRAPDQSKTRHFPVQADGASSGPGQQLESCKSCASSLRNFYMIQILHKCV